MRAFAKQTVTQGIRERELPFSREEAKEAQDSDWEKVGFVKILPIEGKVYSHRAQVSMGEKTYNVCLFPNKDGGVQGKISQRKAA